MRAALQGALLELAGSKKFLVFLATMIAAGAARIGWHVDPNALAPYLAVAGAYIVGQGIADHGKSAAQIAAAAAANSVPLETEPIETGKFIAPGPTPPPAPPSRGAK